MPKPVITYDKDLPEISDRQPHKPPTAFLRKKAGTADDYEIVEGRRPSQMLLVNRLRKAMDKWRSDGYLRNAYRVLLTRARQGMVIFVPPGDLSDPSRSPEYYDSTFQYLSEVGIPVLD